jgi:hypothetical protein
VVYPEFEPFAKYDHWPFHAFMYVILKSSSNLYQVRSGIRKPAPNKAKSATKKVRGRNQNIVHDEPAEAAGGGNDADNDEDDEDDPAITVTDGMNNMSIVQGECYFFA